MSRDRFSQGFERGGDVAQSTSPLGTDDPRSKENDAGQAQHRAGRSLIWKHRRQLLGLIGLVTVAVAWEISADVGLVDPTFSSRPSEVVIAAKDYYVDGPGFGDLVASGKEFGIGFAIALTLGLTLGLIIGWWGHVEEFVNPIVSMGYVTPRITLAPLFIVWFGIETSSKVAMVAVTAVFPILLNTIAGVKGTEASLVSVARSYRGSQFQIFRTVVLPGAVPPIIGGIRLGVGMGLIGMTVGELIASTEGLGFRIQVAAANFEMGLMFAAIGSVTVLGLIMTEAVGAIERRFDRWRPALHQ